MQKSNPVRPFFNTASVAAVLVISALISGGCSHRPTEYSWSHLESGEYLFAFDTRECGELVEREASTPVAASNPATASPLFFNCMQDRGYFLVDPVSGRPLTADAGVRIRPAADPQAVR